MSNQVTSAGLLLKQANQLKRMGRLDEAIALYHQVIKINPHFAWAYHNLGDALVKRGNLEEAVNCYSEGLKINPNSAWLFYSLGEALAQLGDLEVAVKHLKKAIDLKPDFKLFDQKMAQLISQTGHKKGNKTSTEAMARANVMRKLLVFFMNKKFISKINIGWQHIYRIASDEKDYELLKFMEKNEIKIDSWKKLRELSQIIRYTNDNNRYDALMYLYDVKLKLLSDRASQVKFIGDGEGGQALNTYRSLVYEGKILFEKIYSNHHIGIRKIYWFTKNVKKLLNSTFIKVPEVYTIETGEKLTVVYYDYIDFMPIISVNSTLSIAIEILSYFIDLGVQKISEIPDFIKDFKSDIIYAESLKTATTNLRNIDQQIVEHIKIFESKVESVRTVFSHGDLGYSNISSNRYVIDWDSCGIYPIGYDIAYSLSRLFPCNDVRDIEILLKNNFIDRIEKSERENFVFSCLYFCLIFYARRNGVIKASDKLLVGLYSRLVEIKNYQELYHLISNLNKKKYYETTLKQGVAYHSLPFEDLHLNVHRKDLTSRNSFIYKNLDVRGKKGLDIGCAIGGVSFDLQLQGALMTGLDFNKEEIDIAKKVEEIYQTGANFICGEADIFLNDFDFLKKFDFVVWFSQWMWHVKQYGIERAKLGLFNVSKCVDFLFFETSIGDAGAGNVMELYGITSIPSVISLLKTSTVYQNICYWEFNDDGSPLQRPLFFCY